MQMELTPQERVGSISKVERYNWKIKDAPGRFMMLPKNCLIVDETYQRDQIVQKVLDMATAWSWVACGALVVAHRRGVYSVVDGQHRKLAADKRSDISKLPCLVFETTDVRQEAQGFLDINTGRKPISSLARHKARVASGDELAEFVQASLVDLGLKASSTSTGAGNINCIAWAYRRAAEDRHAYMLVLRTAAKISAVDGICVPEKLVEGLWHLHANMNPGIDEPRLAKRIRDVGARRLVEAATKAAAYFAGGGAKIYARGMFDALNRGLREKFAMIGGDD